MAAAVTKTTTTTMAVAATLYKATQNRLMRDDEKVVIDPIKDFIT